MTMNNSEGQRYSQRNVAARMGAYIAEHVFEGVALVFTVAAALNYAVGRSYLDGWAETAGVPGMMFQPDLYDTMLAGVRLESVWRIAAVVVVLSVLYLWLNVVASDWWPGRRSSAKRRRQRQDGYDQLGLRRRYAWAARRASVGVPAEQYDAVIERSRWRALGHRGLRRMERAARPARRVTPPRLITLVAILVGAITLIAASVYVLFRNTLIDPAKADGARDFVKVYAAVTGHIPYQYFASTVSKETLQNWACEGRLALSQYRSVMLADSDAPNVKKEAFYLLQGYGSTFVLLGEKGSMIRSFGDAPFNLPESSTRPLSPLAKGCE
ncbi:hypothetical protein F6X37_18915 [Paraburkholderia sp. 31.1]|uniref:hypothetical protein n=1 Tax=Paraburkholderia sp. 31.1 TaxID=2615205 RepID=UPI00165560DA|nr:hypothetical protein [Paraburkholderia sp. 31.1]MBC8723578.1 hypothetical protein [Paraburkholderia sp. 31.1]